MPLRSPPSLALVLALALPLASLPGSALALPQGGDARLVQAREKFVAAERDEDGARWPDALAKLREVAAVRLTPGVRYHIALCEEHVGQLTAALRDYTEAEREARSEGAEDVLSLVGARIADVDARTPRVAIRVTDAAGLVVRLDGEPIDRTVAGDAVRADPGEHRLEAEAPDRGTSAARVALHERDAVAVDLSFDSPAALAVQPGAGPAADGPPSPRPDPRWRTATLVAGAGAVALSAAGVGAFVAAGNALEDGVRECRGITSLAASACSGEKNAVRAWDWAAAAAWTGAAAGAVIAAVTWTAHAKETRASMRLVVRPGALGLAGTF